MKKLLIALTLILTSQAFGVTGILNRLNGGEMSPLMKSRTDFEKYYSGYQTVENFLVLPQGGVTRRPGTHYIAEVKDSTVEARLVPFVASITEAYVLEFGNTYIRFYSNGSQLQSGGSAYEITSPYQTGELNNLRWVQSNDIMYLFNPDHPIQKLSRSGDTNWTIADVDFTHVPYRAINTTATKMYATFERTSVPAWADATAYAAGDMRSIPGETDTDDFWYLTCINSHTSEAGTAKLEPDEDDFYAGNPQGGNWSGDGYSTGAGNIYWYPYAYYDDDTATSYSGPYIENGATVSININSGDVFNANMVGSRFRLTNTPPGTLLDYEDTDADAADDIYTSTPVRVFGAWTMTSGGTWYGELKIQRSFDYGNTWHDIRILNSDETVGAKNYTVTGDEELDDVFYRIRYNCETDDSKITVEFYATDTELDGEVLIDAVGGTGTIPDGSAVGDFVNLKAHYKLEDNAATASVVDSTGNGYTATLYDDTATGLTSNVTSDTHKVDQAGSTKSFAFDADADDHHIRLPASLATALGTGSRTFAMWIYLADTPSTPQYIFTENSSLGNNRFSMRIESLSKIQLDGQGITNTRGSTALSNTTWYLVVLSYNASSKTAKVYLNGNLDATAKVDSSFLPAATDIIAVGCDIDPGVVYDQFFNGNIDNVLVYSSAVPDENISTLLGTVAASGTVVAPIYDSLDAADGFTEETDLWAESAWSTYRGHPSCGSFFERRLCAAGTETDQQTVWTSQSDDFENFKAGTNDSDGIAYTIASEQNNKILWLTSQSRLGIGTNGGEFVMAASTLDEPITPTNVKVTRQSTYGSSNEQSVAINDSTLFLQRNSKKIREFTYSFEKDGYVAEDMTILAGHITGSGVTDMATQQSPNTILWCIREDGELLGFTYERNNNVTAWHRHVFDGTAESEAVIPGETEDELWLIVNRTVDGSTARYIERMLVKNMQDTGNNYFVDCGTTTDIDAANTITGLDYLEGEVVAVVANDEVLYDGQGTDPNFTVTSGSITIATDSPTYTTVYIGVPYTSKLKTMPLNASGTQQQGRTKRITSITLRTWRSLAAKIGTRWDTYETLDFDTSTLSNRWDFYDTDDLDTYGSITGDYQMDYNGDYETEAAIYIQSDQPLPLTITAIMPEYETYN